jgi:hypothetical protein
LYNSETLTATLAATIDFSREALQKSNPKLPLGTCVCSAPFFVLRILFLIPKKSRQNGANGVNKVSPRKYKVQLC